MGEPAQSIAQRARNRLGVVARTDPDKVDDARRELAAARLEQHIRETIDAAPPLTPEQRDRLARLLTTATPAGAVG